MVAVLSLDLIAFAHRHVRRAIFPVIDARRGEVFCALYRHAPGGSSGSPATRCSAPTSWPPGSRPEARSSCCVATGPSLHREAFEHLGELLLVAAWPRPRCRRPPWSSWPFPRMLREEFTSLLEVTPLYLRWPDIGPNVERRLAAERIVVAWGPRAEAPIGRGT